MNKIIDKFKKILWNSGDFYITITASFILIIVNIITCIASFSWVFISYIIFLTLMLIFNIFLKKVFINSNKIYLIGAIFLLILILPMGQCFVLTILFRNYQTPIWFWIPYLYALFVTIKTTLCIRGFIKNKTPQGKVNSILNIVSTLYTIQMLEFTLIMEFGKDTDLNNMIILQYVSQAVIIAVTLFLIIHLFISQYKKINHN